MTDLFDDSDDRSHTAAEIEDHGTAREVSHQLKFVRILVVLLYPRQLP